MTNHRHLLLLWTIPGVSAFLPTPPLSLHRPTTSVATNSYLDTLSASDIGGGITSYLDTLSPPSTASDDDSKSSYLDTLSDALPSSVLSVAAHDGVGGGDDGADRTDEGGDTSPSTTGTTEVTTTPVFDFTGGSSGDGKAKSLASFDRIDDAIMGGISVSSLRDPGEGVPYATWSGICRTEGGGFCGFRTLPFLSPLSTTNQSGIYIDCRLASDDEPRRRVWKMTLRTQAKRTTEVVYQAEFDLGEGGGEGEWSRVTVPFDSFQLVRGPRLVPDMPPADVSEGIYQIGISLSKFVMGVNMTELPDFRPGYFDLQIQSIGFFNDAESPVPAAPTTTPTPTSTSDETPILPATVTKTDADRSRPALIQLLSPLLNFLFSEKSRRRRTAMKLLTETRGSTRWAAMRFGVRNRSRGGRWGSVKSVVRTAGIVGVDVARTVVKEGLKLVVFYPFRLLFRLVGLVKRALGVGVDRTVTE